MPDNTKGGRIHATENDKAGFLEKLTSFAQAMDFDSQEAVYLEVKFLKAELERLAAEVEQIKGKL